MKTTYMMALVAMVSIIATFGAITVNGSMVSMATGSAYSETSPFMGHVEYTLYNSNGDIKAYGQADNIVVDQGDDCAAEALFLSGPDVCTTFTVGTDSFRFIGIGNATSDPIANSDLSLAADGTANTVAQGSAEGLMAMKEDTNIVITPSDANGAVAVISTTGNPFNFKADTGNNDDNNNTNATTVLTAGLFSKACDTTAISSGQCTAIVVADVNMFAAQVIAVTVGEGDSLDVTWTITVGGG